MGHIDHSLLLGYHHEARKNNIVDSTNLLQQLGFVIHAEKSVFASSASYSIPWICD
jgi:hypothetical protein